VGLSNVDQADVNQDGIGDACDECTPAGYSRLEDETRRVDHPGDAVRCDSGLAEGWYRFVGDAGTQLPTTPPDTRACNTHAPGWLDGDHPTPDQLAVDARVCFHWGADVCNWSQDIRVRNCGDFFVYRLAGTVGCSLRFCGAASPDECRPDGYGLMDEPDRNVAFNDGNGGVDECDTDLFQGANAQPAWYRFTGEAGTQMPTEAPEIYACGTDAPGWLDGQHPSEREGVVNANACYHWSGDTCRWSNPVRVRNCGGFYTYELGRPPACSLRYCGE